MQNSYGKLYDGHGCSRSVRGKKEAIDTVLLCTVRYGDHKGIQFTYLVSTKHKRLSSNEPILHVWSDLAYVCIPRTEPVDNTS